MDAIFESMGGLGRSQKIYLFIIGMVNSITGLNFYSSVFFTAEPSFFCKKTYSYKNVSSEIESLNKCDMWNNFTLSKETGNTSPYECEFSDEHYNLTIVNDWGLVCDKQYLLSLSQTFFSLEVYAHFLMDLLVIDSAEKRLVLFLSCFSQYPQLFISS